MVKCLSIIFYICNHTSCCLLIQRPHYTSTNSCLTPFCPHVPLSEVFALEVNSPCLLCVCVYGCMSLYLFFNVICEFVKIFEHQVYSEKVCCSDPESCNSFSKMQSLLRVSHVSFLRYSTNKPAYIMYLCCKYEYI